MTQLRTHPWGALMRVIGEGTETLAQRSHDVRTIALRARDPLFRRSCRALAKLEGRYAGERCFIVGNGPSLNVTEMSKLQSEHTFALNRGHLMFDRLGFPSTFLVAVNPLVVMQFGDELVSVPSVQKFISWDMRHYLPAGTEVTFVRSTRGPRFCTNPTTQGVWEGYTVTFVAMQLAYYMGFDTVVLIGVDHSFQSQGDPNALVTSGGDDPDHFDPGYFGKGTQWHLPDLAGSEMAYGLALREFDKAERTILDATVGGRLEIFPKVEYTRLF